MIGGVSDSTLPFQTQFKKNLGEQDRVLLRLASGRRINSGEDDPAGLITAHQLEGALAALEAESRALERTDANANIADGQTAQLAGMMSELRGLVVAGANTAGMSDAEIEANQLQIDSLSASIQRFAQDAGSSIEGLGLPDNGSAQLAEQLRSAANAVATLTSGNANDLYSGNFEAAEAAVKDAASAFAQARGTIGAYQQYTVQTRQSSLAVERENLAAAHSRIVDADFALETSNLARAQVLTATSAQVLKIASNNANLVLSLLS